MKRTILGLAPLTLAIITTSLACSDDAPGTDEVGETGDGDGDPGDGDGDPGDGDGDGDGEGDGDGDDPPPPDTDMDGVADPDDNCPDVANPNQLDYDGNGAGNVCDTQVFTTLGGTLMTTANVDARALGDCSIPVPFEITGGEVRVQLDDDAAVAAFEIVSLEIADVLDQECSLLVPVDVSLKDVMIANNGDPFPVSVPHSLMAHDAGSIAGDSDVPHPMLATATLEANVNNMPSESPLELDGALPIFTANISGGGTSGTLAWADGQFVVAMDTFTIEEPFMTDVMFEMRGLIGSITVAP